MDRPGSGFAALKQLAEWAQARPRVLLAGMILFGLAMWAAMLPATFGHNEWVYSWDSAAYLETAESLHAGRGLYHRVIHGLGPQIWEPLTLWPPGYPIMIAAVMALGLSAKTACLVVSAGAAALSLILLGVIALRVMKWPLACSVMILVAVSSSFQAISTQCLSDSSYYCWVLGSVACVVEWVRRPRASWRWMLAAGLFAGAAFCTRNAAIALFAATGVLMLAQLAWRRFAEMFRIGLIWAGGVAATVAPMVLYNLAAFGRINPYDMPASDLSLAHNISRAVSVIVGDMTTLGPLAGLAFNNTVPVLGAAGLLVAALVWLAVRRGAHAPLPVRLQRYGAPLFIAAYAVFSAALIIIARTKYRWGEEISSRYLVQIYWALWISLAVWGAAILNQTRLSARVRSLALAGVFIAAVGLHLGDTRWVLLNKPGPNAQSLEAQLGPQGCAALEGAGGEGQIVMATRADLLRIHCGLNARPIAALAGADDSLRRAMTEEDLQGAIAGGHLWGFVIHDVAPVVRGDHGAVLQEIVTTPERRPGFVRVAVPGTAHVLRYDDGKS